MKRREFICLLGGAAIAWPLAAQAQQPEQVLLPATADDAVFKARLGVFLQELPILGWAIGRNTRIDVRWASADASEIRRTRRN
jgi:putative ABC transport system substrate-binding protein